LGESLKILVLDIETAPNEAYVWGLWQQNVGINQIKENGYVLCWSAKWVDGDKIVCLNKTHPQFLQIIHQLLSEADAVVHFNGKRFDIPILNGEFIKAGMLPPATYKQIDLKDVVKSSFRFPSNKLAYVTKVLGVGEKKADMVFEDWVGCINNDPEAWKKMMEYNIHDVTITEALYKKLVPWIKNHPNVGLYHDNAHSCPNCGGAHLERRGFAYTALGKFQRFQCKDCGTWSRDRKNMAVKGIFGQDKN
jgi:DNA polymerase elongation subunit (family B)